MRATIGWKNDMSNAITLSHVSKTFDDPSGQPLLAVKNVSLAIRTGEFFVFLGPSGSGKSTLLRLMSGLEKTHEGSITLAPNIAQSDMAFVFQQFALFPWLTVRKNVELGLLRMNLPEAVRGARVAKELKRLGLQKFANAYPRELSGGLRQRVGLARALVVNPKIIFMDEPFSELDSFTAEDLRQEVLRIWEATGITIVMVTHLITEAIELADRIAVLTPRPAALERVVVNTLPRPRAKRSQEFFSLEDKLYRLIKP